MSLAHFYGELTKTEEGCQLLREKEHFREFAKFIRDHGMERSDAVVISKLKSILWAVGNIGASKSGLQFLEEEDIVKDIVSISENSAVLSLKGTCFFVLGLIAKTASGVKILEDLKWECVYDPHTEIGTGLCCPTNSEAFLSFPKWTYRGFDHTPDLPIKSMVPSSQVERDLLKAMANLTNRILSSIGSKSLSKIRSQHPQVFTQIELYYKVVQMLSSYHYRLPTRRLVSELFDVDFTAATLDKLDKLVEAQKRTTETNGTSDDAADEDEDNLFHQQKMENFRRVHRGSDGVVAIISEDRADLATEVVPKQELQPLKVIKGFET